MIEGKPHVFLFDALCFAMNFVGRHILNHLAVSFDLVLRARTFGAWNGESG
jgi:hypothetical protein